MISKEEIQHLAQLARLQVSEEETAALQQDISNILDYVGQVTAASDVALERPEVRNVLRADVLREADDPMAEKREAILAQLPKREGDYNVVRKIIDK